jgi:hypothetical protein
MSALGDLKWNGEPIELTIGTQGRNWGMNFGLRIGNPLEAQAHFAIRNSFYPSAIRIPQSAIHSQSIFARILVNPVVQTCQVWPPDNRNMRSGGRTPLNRSIPGSRRSTSP